jgi:hypothetical protein
MAERADAVDTMKIIDTHMHCGTQHVDLPFELIKPLLHEAGIAGACIFPPVEDIYDRYQPNFQDTDAWRRTRHAANRYVLNLAARGEAVFPYLFVWNDFALEELQHPYCGIKWHRHPNEPVYHYEDPRCARLIQEITERRLPVVLEESFSNTLRFAQELAPETVIIIPHLGALNGSYQALEEAGVWRRLNTYTDSALAAPEEIRHFLEQYGPDRLLFGSDFPFGMPGYELHKLQRLGLPDVDLAKILAGNFLALMKVAGCHK